MNLTEIRRCDQVDEPVEPGLVVTLDRLSLLDALKTVDPGRDEGRWHGRTEFVACLVGNGRPVLKARQDSPEAGIPLGGLVKRPGVAYLPVDRVRRLLRLMTEDEVVLRVKPPGTEVTIVGDRKWFSFVSEGYRLHDRLHHGPVTPPLF